MVSFKLLAKITIITALLLMPLVAGAVQVPWSYEWYRAYADGYAEFHGGAGGDDYVTDEATGPAPPLYAEVEDSYGGGAFTAGSTIESSFMKTYAYIGGYELIGLGAYATGEFRGQYTADQPFFEISYDYDYSYYSQTDSVYSEAWLRIDDLTNPENLFDGTFDLSSDTGSGVLTISVPVGHEVEVNFGIDSLSGTRWDSSYLLFNYNMAVTPEPVSSMLFLSGGATLAIGYLRKKRKKSS